MDEDGFREFSGQTAPGGVTPGDEKTNRTKDGARGGAKDRDTGRTSERAAGSHDQPSGDSGEEKEHDLRRRGRLFVKRLLERTGLWGEIEDPAIVENRRKAKRAKDPGFKSFANIFSSIDKETGKHIPFGERMKKIYQLGAYHVERLGDWGQDMVDRMRQSADDKFDKANRIGKDFWDETREDRKEAMRHAEEQQEGKGGRAARESRDIVPRGPGGSGMREAWPDDRSINSNHVGPERQVRHGPDLDRIAGPGRRTTGAMVSSPRRLERPDTPRFSDAPEAGDPDRPANGAPGSGAAAAEKGAQQARRIAARSGSQAGSKKRDARRDADDMER